ncbi:uncharacterized protein O3C94_002685 isoform 2-T2 [Discoglossus pictus]
MIRLIVISQICILISSTPDSLSLPLSLDLVTDLGSQTVMPLGVHLQSCDVFVWRLSAKASDCDGLGSVYDLHYNVSKNGSLEVHNVTREHAGFYTVEVYNSTGQSIYSNSFTLHVHDRKMPFHLISKCAVCLLYSLLLVCMVRSLIKMKRIPE